MEQENKPDLFQQFTLDHTARQHLRSMISWARIIVITTVAGYVFSLIAMIVSPKKTVSRYEGFDMGLPVGGNEIVSSIVSMGVGLLICFFLFRFATQTRKALDELNQPALSSGFTSLKYYFVTLSIFLIIIFVIVLLVFVTVGVRRVV